MRVETPQRPALPEGWGVSIGTGIGAALGLIVGLLLGQLALGLTLGAASGLVAGATSTTALDVPANHRRVVLATAITILAGGVVAVVLVWLG